MALPKLSYPTFDLIVPSTKKKVKFRPFLVKEEKLLLMAKQSAERNDILSVLKQVITNCDVGSSVDVDTLATFDIEYLFLKLRAKSVNNIIDIVVTDPDDEQDYKISIDVDKVEVVFNENHKNVIELTDTSGITMKYPSTELFSQVINDPNVTNILFTMIKGCMDTVYEGDNIANFSDQTVAEVDEFVDSLPANILKQFELFFETMPKLYHKVQYTNSLGETKDIELRTLEDFF